MIADCEPPVAIVAHDAGAANHIFAWLERSGDISIRPALAGPAAQIWSHRYPGKSFLSDPLQALSGASTVITGTGWASDFEHTARIYAAQQAIYSIAVVDHWVNYRMRFERKGAWQFPDEVWVADPFALSIARRELPECSVKMLPNSYLECEAAKAGPPPEDGDALFILEPVRDDWNRGIPGEFQALDFFWDRRKNVPGLASAKVRLRLHPSDHPRKYDAWVEAHEGVALDCSSELAGALRRAQWVVGLNSMALVVALEARRKVLSAIPPWGGACKLPHPGIGNLI